jgi:hypothetical protein
MHQDLKQQQQHQDQLFPNSQQSWGINTNKMPEPMRRKVQAENEQRRKKQCRKQSG